MSVRLSRLKSLTLSRVICRTLDAIIPAMHVPIPIPPGELCDRLTITELKVARGRFEDPAALDGQLALYRSAFEKLPRLPQVSASLSSLRRYNGILWRLEDEIRSREAARDHGQRFVSIARLICRVNDRRSREKRVIDEAFGMYSAETKIYGSYKAIA